MQNYSLIKSIRSSVQLKMLLAIAIPTILVTTVILLFGFRYFIKDTRAVIENHNLLDASSTAATLGSQLAALEQTTRLMSNFISANPGIDSDSLVDLVTGSLEINPLVFGSAAAFEPYAFDPGKRLYSPYAYRSNEDIALLDIGDVSGSSGYDYTNGEWEWWSAAKDRNRGIWTAPYFDEGAGNVLMSTYSMPFYDGDQFRGVVTVDILLESIFNELGLTSGNEFIVDPQGAIIFSANADDILHGNLMDLPRHEGMENLMALLHEASVGSVGNHTFEDDAGRAYWGIYSRIPQTGWIYINLLPEKQVLQLLAKQEQMFGVMLVLTWLILSLLIWLISKRIMVPIMALHRAAMDVVQGNYAVALPEQTGDELGQLSNRFGEMISVLARKNEDWQRQLEDRTAQISLIQDQVQAQKEIIERALEGIDIGIIMYNRELTILATNNKLWQVVDISEAEKAAITDFREFKKYMFRRRGEVFIETEFLEKAYPDHFAREVVKYTSGQLLEKKFSPINQDMFIHSYEDVTESETRSQELGKQLQELDKARKATLNMMQDAEEARKLIQQSELELKDQLNFNQALMDTLPSPVFYKGADTRFLGFNKAYEQTFGVNASDLIGKRVADLEYLPEADRIKYQQEDEEVVSTSGSLRYEISMPFADGKLHDTLYWVTGFKQRDGSPGGLIGTFIDITEQKETAKALEIAKEEAEAATKAKASFLASMSHEIRTPMNAVIGMVDLLRQTELGDEQQDMLQTISLSGQSLLSIINDILDLSKIESGRFELERISLSLVESVEGAARTVSVNAQKKGIGLLTYIDPRIPSHVLGDPVRIRQILINLIGNAIKFTEQGNILIRVCLDEDHEKEVAVTFSVKDKGIGISKEAQKALFTEFTQAESSTTRKYGGTGLGLSICLRLTDMMGGTINVESELGQGSEFIVKLRFPVDRSKATVQQEMDLDKVRILLVENNEEEAAMLASYLQHWNAQVSRCKDLETARTTCLAAAKAVPFDVVIVGSQWSRAEKFGLAEQVLSEQDSKTRFVVLAVGKRVSTRIVNDNSLTLDIAPFTRMALIQTISIALGRASPVVHHKKDEDLKATRPALSVEEAMQAGTLILVAEDNPTNRDVIGRQLKLLGHTCEMGEDGRQALKMWQSGRYAILLTDCHMPEMDGFELTAAIRDIEEKRQVSAGKRFPIIAITANALQGEAERCLAAGMDGYMSKPIDIKELRNNLRQYLTLPERKEEPVIHAAKPAETSKTSTQTDNKAEAREVVAAEPSVLSEPAVPKEVAAVDASVLKDMFGDDEETFREILQDFVAPSTQIVAEMQQACASKSAEDLRQAAHKLKSAARSIGANKLADLCLVLETAGKLDQLGSIETKMGELAAEMTLVKAFIAALK